MSPIQRVVQLVKWVIAVGLGATGVLALLRRRRARRGAVTVLWFHRVAGEVDRRVPMGVPPVAFQALLRGLTKRYRIASWEACLDAVRTPSDTPTVALTFDDGYRDNATHAWPLIRAVGGTGIFCLTTSFVDGTPLWWEQVAAVEAASNPAYPVDSAGEATYGPDAETRIAALKEVRNRDRLRAVAELTARVVKRPPPGALSWDEAREMDVEGAIIAGHTATHPILTRCDSDELGPELAGSRERLEKEIGHAVTLFAYPNGSVDATVAEATRAAGYTHAFTTEKGLFMADTDPFLVPRIGVSEPKYSLDGKGFSWRLFEAEMLGVFDVLLARHRRR